MKNETKQNNIIGRHNGRENSRRVVREDIWECNTVVSLKDESQPPELWKEASRQKEKRAKIPQIRHKQDMCEELKESHCGWSVTSGFPLREVVRNEAGEIGRKGAIMKMGSHWKGLMWSHWDILEDHSGKGTANGLSGGKSGVCGLVWKLMR